MAPNQVTIQGKDMSLDAAAKIVIREVDSRGGAPWLHLNKVLDELVVPDAQFAVKDAVYFSKMGQRLN